MGGRAAAFAGIAILVTGIVFLVGYAIQHAWIGPGTRIVLGLLAGGALVGTGHFVGSKDAKYTLLARVLTGGGSALFYFSVFAAYGIYHLIGAVAAGAGLLASALAVFGLAMAYRSQAVGVLGVLGAFTTPLLIGGDIDAGIFPLAYVALINIPVLLLGVRRKAMLITHGAPGAFLMALGCWRAIRLTFWRASPENLFRSARCASGNSAPIRQARRKNAARPDSSRNFLWKTESPV